MIFLKNHHLNLLHLATEDSQYELLLVIGMTNLYLLFSTSKQIPLPSVLHPIIYITVKQNSTMRYLSFIALFVLTACGVTNEKNTVETPTPSVVPAKTQAVTDLDKLSKAYFASGCFWCVEAVYESVRGVAEAVSGYAGGDTPNPTYRLIGTGKTGHAEALEVYYDPAVVTYQTLVKVYYGSQDPTTVNGQHPDYGTQYRSMIFYQNEEEKKIAQTFKANLEASGEYDKPIATEIVPFKKFWKAEDYHQNYERLNPNNPYVRNVSIPRLKRFQAKYPELLKDTH